MKRAHVFLLSGLILFAPLVVSAAWSPGQPLVPPFFTGDDFHPAQVTYCDLVTLVDNLLDFGVYLAALVATVMFVYAGFLYVTASARQENISQAKSIFGKVFLGFVVILTGWLIVNIILDVTTGDDINVWVGGGSCSRPDIQLDRRTGPSIREATSAPIDQRDEEQKRAVLNTCGTGVNHRNACQPGQTTGCTTISGLSVRSLGYACNLGKECRAAAEAEGRVCEVTVTGGSEEGHAGGTNPGSHGAGDKIDLRRSAGLGDYIDDQVENGRFTEVDNPTFGQAQWIDTQTGAVWTDEGDHYDVCVENCATPSARDT